MNRRRASASYAAASMAICGVGIDFPTRRLPLGLGLGLPEGCAPLPNISRWMGDPRFEQLVLGWVDSTHDTAGKVLQYFNKTIRGCIWSSQINTRARHGKEMVVRVVHKVRGTWQGHEVAFYIAVGLGYLPW